MIERKNDLLNPVQREIQAQKKKKMIEIEIRIHIPTIISVNKQQRQH